MGFSDTLKELLDQGLMVSKDLAATAGEKAQDLGTKSLKASSEFASKAGAKLQELGDKGVLKMDIKQMEIQTKKLIGLLGAEVYRLSEQGNPVSTDEPAIKSVLDQINAIKGTLEEKETELANR